MEKLRDAKNHTVFFVFSRKIKKMAASNVSSWLLLSCFFFIVAAAAHSGFFAKWSLHDELSPLSKNKYSVESMIDGIAHKPFVYRQLVPAIANLAEGILPPQFKSYLVKRFDPSESYSRATSANRMSYAFRYRVIYTLHFLSLFFSLFLLRAICRRAGVGQMEAVFAPTAFILAFPYLQTVGGYFYDGVELFFLSSAVLAALRGRYLILIGISAIATYNKESFIFFVPTLYPLFRFNFNRNHSVAAIVPAILISAAVNLQVKTAFASNDGGVVEFHLLENFRNYLTPYFYRQLEITYGIPGPHGVFFLTLFLILIISVRGWSSVPQRFRTHAIFCSAINFPLFISFCATGELRNLSFMYIIFVIVLAFSLKSYAADNADIESSSLK